MSDGEQFRFDDLVSLFERTHRELHGRAARSVDTALVARNWLFGCYLVEYEKADASRAELYGKALIQQLSASLKACGLRGISPTNLRKFRAFYEAYPGNQQISSVESAHGNQPGLEMQQTVSVESLLLAQAGDRNLDSLTSWLASRFKLG